MTVRDTARRTFFHQRGANATFDRTMCDLQRTNMLGVIMWEPDDTQAPPAQLYSDGASYPYFPGWDYGVSRRHLPGCNLLFTDAHVEFKKYEIGMAECMDPTKNNEFWFK
jgi:prepilin-type processing-associated H-X9-DG protein